MTYGKKYHIIKALKKCVERKRVMLYYLLVVVFLLANGIYIAIKNAWKNSCVRVFGRKKYALKIICTKIFIKREKLGFFYCGKLPQDIKKYGVCIVRGRVETKIVCFVGAKEDAPSADRERFERRLSRAGGVELITLEARINKVFSIWMKIAQREQKIYIPLSLREQETTPMTAKLLIQAAAKAAVAVWACRDER